MDELKSEAKGVWTLSSDAKLQTYLSSFSTNLAQKTKALSEKIDDLSNDTDETEVRLRNTFNEFLLLSNTQFIENRVYDDEDENETEESKVDPSASSARESSKVDIQSKLKNALTLGQEAMKLFFDQDDYDNVDEGADIYNRPLPYVIGTHFFIESNDAGLFGGEIGGGPDAFDDGYGDDFGGDADHARGAVADHDGVIDEQEGWGDDDSEAGGDHNHNEANLRAHEGDGEDWGDSDSDAGRPAPSNRQRQISDDFSADDDASAGGAEDGVPLSQHPLYEKYFKMLKIGQPRQAILNKMAQEGVDTSILDRDPNERVPVDEHVRQSQRARDVLDGDDSNDESNSAPRGVSIPVPKRPGGRFDDDSDDDDDEWGEVRESVANHVRNRSVTNKDFFGSDDDEDDDDKGAAGGSRRGGFDDDDTESDGSVGDRRVGMRVDGDIRTKLAAQLGGGGTGKPKEGKVSNSDEWASNDEEDKKAVQEDEDESEEEDLFGGQQDDPYDLFGSNQTTAKGIRRNTNKTDYRESFSDLFGRTADESSTQSRSRSNSTDSVDSLFGPGGLNNPIAKNKSGSQHKPRASFSSLFGDANDDNLFDTPTETVQDTSEGDTETTQAEVEEEKEEEEEEDWLGYKRGGVSSGVSNAVGKDKGEKKGVKAMGASDLFGSGGLFDDDDEGGSSLFGEPPAKSSSTSNKKDNSKAPASSADKRSSTRMSSLFGDDEDEDTEDLFGARPATKRFNSADLASTKTKESESSNNDSKGNGKEGTKTASLWDESDDEDDGSLFGASKSNKEKKAPAATATAAAKNQNTEKKSASLFDSFDDDDDDLFGTKKTTPAPTPVTTNAESETSKDTVNQEKTAASAPAPAPAPAPAGGIPLPRNSFANRPPVDNSESDHSDSDGDDDLFGNSTSVRHSAPQSKPPSIPVTTATNTLEDSDDPEIEDEPPTAESHSRTLDTDQEGEETRRGSIGGIGVNAMDELDDALGDGTENTTSPGTYPAINRGSLGNSLASRLSGLDPSKLGLGNRPVSIGRKTSMDSTHSTETDSSAPDVDAALSRAVIGGGKRSSTRRPKSSKAFTLDDEEDDSLFGASTATTNAESETSKDTVSQEKTAASAPAPAPAPAPAGGIPLPRNSFANRPPVDNSESDHSDSDGDDDLFGNSTSKTTTVAPAPVVSQSAKDADNDLFGQSTSKDAKDDLFGESTSSSSATPSLPAATNKTSSDLFSAEDDGDDLFGDSTSSITASSKAAPAKKKQSSLFDDDDDDLFGAPVSRKKQDEPKKKQSSLFDDDDEDDLFK